MKTKTFRAFVGGLMFWPVPIVMAFLLYTLSCIVIGVAPSSLAVELLIEPFFIGVGFRIWIATLLTGLGLLFCNMIIGRPKTQD